MGLSSTTELAYVETVVGTRQIVDKSLPADALRCAIVGADNANVAYRYREPIAALHDDDFVLPDHITFAYYAVYNLFQKYAAMVDVDDWLIVNQAISAELDLDVGADRFAMAVARIDQT